MRKHLAALTRSAEVRSDLAASTADRSVRLPVCRWGQGRVAQVPPLRPALVLLTATAPQSCKLLPQRVCCLCRRKGAAPESPPGGAPRVLTLFLGLKPTLAFHWGWAGAASIDVTYLHTLLRRRPGTRVCQQRIHAECAFQARFCAQRQSRTPELKPHKMQPANEARLPHLSLGHKGCTCSAVDSGRLDLVQRSRCLLVSSSRSPCSTKGWLQPPDRGPGPRHRESEIMSRVGLTALCCQQSRCHLPIY